MADHPIPLAALDGKTGILGITGSGKSFTAIGLVELLLAADEVVIVIDPTGAYSGLRTAFPIPIFGGKFGDVPLREADGEAIAQAILDSRGSAVVDISLLLKDSHASARRFMRTFVATLKRAPTAARYLVMDEADEFMPENASGDSTQLFGDLKWIVRRGRIEGWRMLMVTQRPQDIAKSVLTQCETMILHRLMAPQDRKAVEEWVKGNADNEIAKTVLQSLASLETGEAWVWSPKHGILERLKMPANRSEDRSRTPGAGDAPHDARRFKPIDIDKLKAALARSDSQNATDATTDNNRLTDKAAPSDLSGQLAAMDRKNADLIRANAECASVIANQLDEIATLTAERDRFSDFYSDRMRRINGAIALLGDGLGEVAAISGGEPNREEGQAEENRGESRRQAPRVPTRPPAARTVIGQPDGGNAPSGAPLPKRAVEVLAVLAAVAPKSITEKQWAARAGVRQASSTWRGYRVNLKGAFNQVGADCSITDEGLAALPPGAAPALPPPGLALVEHWCKEIKVKAAVMLRQLAAEYPQSISRARLAELVGVDPGISTFRGYLADLNSLDLVEWRGDQATIAAELVVTS